MNTRNPIMRVLSVVLVLTMLVSVSPMASARAASAPISSSDRQTLSIERVEGIDIDAKLTLPEMENKLEEDTYADTDSVRVSIVLEQQPTLELYSTIGIADNASAMSYRKGLIEDQVSVTAAIEKRALKGVALDVVWNMTLAANIISANVLYGQIDAIAAVKGVREVVIEDRYDPLTTTEGTAQPFMSTATGMTGAGTAWAAGYTGAGTRIAVIDTGLDTDHQSFSNDAFLYSLEAEAARRGEDAAAFIESLDLLDKEEIGEVLTDLNIYPYVEYNSLTHSGQYYLNEKVPFALNYVDRNYQVTHDKDAQGGHGSHVAGIAAANRYIENAEGGFDNALESVYAQGVAPDAQLIIMKVFGEQGGAYESDYMVAIEDAIMLGCDVVNLSLGSNKGFARSQLYQDILDSLAGSDTVVAIAGGNSGAWADYSANGIGALYADDVDFSVIGSPATATNSLSVASVENTGFTDYYMSVGETILYYNKGVANNAYTKGLNVIGGVERTYILLDSIGTAEEVNAVAAQYGDVSEAVLVVARGEIAFSDKAVNAAAAGFAGCIVYNNVEGSFNMDLTAYEGTAPCVSITKADAEVLRNAAEAVSGDVNYYVGTLFISDAVIPNAGDGDVTMSSFSSWGVPGSLELKPEISAPGGNIYSVNGENPSGDAYMNNSGTSMASPQIAGLAAVVMQYIQENGLCEKTGLSARALATSLLMSTAEPLVDAESGSFYSILQQGSGLANVSDAIAADAYILMDENATIGAKDGKVKAELGDDPDRNGVYSFGFTIHNFSESVKSYALTSDFFTQGLFEQSGILFHDTATVSLPVNVSYKVDGESLSVSSSFSCDLNGDGLTDAQDAQVILEYAAGSITGIDGKADLDINGVVNSYDAHVLLSSLRSDYFAVQPGKELHVEVTVELTDKAALDASYVNGAYVEGFVGVESAPDAEGLVDPVYSIPVLAFYGNWTDGSMYDRANYTDYVYGDYLYPYTGGLNYLSFYYDGGADESIFVGNPYLIEDSFPAEKAAISTSTELGDMAVTLIRNAAGFLFYVLDEDGNVVEARSGEHLYASYYYEAYATWVNVNNVGLQIWETPDAFGFEHGDKFTIGFMSVPEYYEKNGALTTEDLTALMQSGEIGSGAFHSYTFTVDDNAPVVSSVEKDNETGNLIVTAQDENYIAAVAVLNAKGSNILTMVGTEQTEQGGIVETVVDMSDVSVNRDCLVMVADYAGNETVYKVTGYNDGINNYAGMMYGFADYPTRGSENSWMHIEPEKLFYGTNSEEEIIMGGTSDVANMPFTVVAAEYAGEHVFMATADGKLYAAEQGDWENALLVGEHRNYAKIKDMAYDTQSGTMYALIGTANTIYSVDLFTGALTKQYTVSLSFPRTVEDANYELLTLAIDDEGNFYAVNNGNANYKRTYLFKWSDADREDGKNVKNLAPVNNTEDGFCGDYIYSDNEDYRGESCVQSMAWDHDSCRLYWASAMAPVSPSNILYTFDTQSGKASVATTAIDGIEEYYLGVLNINTAGLYIVPTETGLLPTATEATGVSLDRTELSLLETAEYTLKTDVFPWNLENRELIWTSSDASVATVENGVITAVSAGTATITATTAAAPNVSASCVVTVEKLQSVDLRALLYDAESNTNWVDFDLTDPAGWTAITDAGKNFQAGALLEGNLYLHDGNHMYGVDANTFEITDYGYVDPTWQWSDAATAPLTPDGYFDRIVGVINFGRGFGVMDVTTGIGSELPHYYLFSKDAAALVAYKDTITYTDEYGSYPAHQYYVLTEQGTLMLMTTWAFYDTDLGSVMYADVIEDLGETGLRLLGAGDVTSGRYGSMHYNAENDYLIVSYCDGKTNELYVFDPDICAPAHVGSFGEDVWPVVSLYEYIPYDELTVTVEPESAEIYVGEDIELTAKVYLYESDKSVTWTSSDETVAAVDENGVVTGISAGTVTITATSVEGAASASAQITVKPLDSQEIWLHGYITTNEGGKWVAINGSDMSYEVLASSDASYTGAGVAEGKVYATDKQYYYEIDPKNDYAVVQGDDFTNADGSECLYMLDGTSAPKTSVTMPDMNTGLDATAEMGGVPVYLSGFDGSGYHYITLLEDFTTGKYSVSPIAYTYNPAAIAYRSSEVIEGSYWFDFYMVLGYDGLIETYSLYSAIAGGEVIKAGGWENDSYNTGLVFEDGDDVSMVYVATDTFDGVIISHADQYGVSFYSFDMTTHTLGKLGSIADATDLVGLSLLSDVGVEIPTEPDVGSDKSLHGYIVTEEGGAWVSIDTSDMGYKAQSDWSDVEYTGAGVLDGKIYASDATTYYEIDPENGYAVTAGGNVKWDYPMLDATGVPAQTVELMDIFDNVLTTQNVGGQVVYTAADDVNTPYLFRLTNYATGAAKYSFLDTVTSTLAGIVFLSAEVAEDASAYTEHYLVLDQSGKLTNVDLSYTVGAGYISADLYESEQAKLELTAANGVSMTLYDEDTVMISVNAEDGVKLYAYTISSSALELVGVIEDAVTLTGLSLLSEVKDEEVIPEPEPADSFHGYITTEQGSAWVSINTSDLSYETLSDWSDAEYTGAGVLDGKIYASDATNYYEIDPANGYAATIGGNVKWDYPMLDATGVPAQTVQLNDIFDNVLTTQNVGGQVVYAAADDVNTPYIFRLTDYAAGSAKYSFLDTVTSTLAGIVFLSAEVAEDASAYTEHYLVLDQSGKLTNVDLSYTVGAGYISADLYESERAKLDLTAGNGASMAKMDDDTIVISVNADDGVKLYTYTISTSALELLGVIEDAVSLVGLSMTSDLGAKDEEPTPDPEPTDPTEPSEPEPTDPEEITDALFGYVTLEDGKAWVQIDPTDLSYNILASDTAAYTGMGVSNGKIYSSTGVSKYGQTTYTFAIIDPAHGFSATAGGTCPGMSYAMADGTGAPAVSVTLADGTTVNAGGYYVYIANGPYASSASKVYLLRTDLTTTEPYISSSAFSGKLAAIAYIGGELSADGLSYLENFLILSQKGNLYRVQLVTKADGLYGQANVSSVTTLDLNAASGASMTLVGNDTVMIAANSDDGVTFYTYSISSQELTEVGAIYDALSLVGLNLYADIAPQETAANVARGSTLALDLSGENAETVENTFTLKLVEDVPVTNGVVEITYDPSVMTYTGTSSLTASYAVNASESGKLVIAYAAAEAISAGELIAAVRFSYDGKTNTSVTVTVTERGEAYGLSESETIELGKTELPFVDVTEGQWFYEYVEYVYENGLMNGMSETIFAPAGTVNRAMVVTVLYRMAGSPEVTELSNFVDVPANSFYANAIAWAEDVGIAKGVTTTHFAPGNDVTREQAAMFLYRFVTGYLGVEAGEGADLSVFTDGDAVAPSAKEAMGWAVAQGLINGYPDGTLNPTGKLNRAELAKLLTILDQQYNP